MGVAKAKLATLPLLMLGLLAVIAGNLVGGSVLVGLTYHVIYRRGQSRPKYSNTEQGNPQLSGLFLIG